MTTANKVIISELPVDKLLEASTQLVREEHVGLQTSLMRCSPILNPTIANRPQTLVFDLDGLKAQLANAEQGLVGTIEKLRELWRVLEHHCRVNGIPPERTIESIKSMTNEKIAEAAILAVVRQKEATKLQKKATEIDSQQKAQAQQKRLYLGAVKRARQDAKGVWQISEADGMNVDENGIITELGIHLDEYLAKCRERKSKKRGAIAA